MANELIRYLVALTLATSLGIIAALLLRRAARLAFGPIASYATWLLVPVAMAAVFLPHVRDPGSPLGITLGFDSTSALRYVLGASAGPAVAARSSPDWPAWALGAWGTGAALFVSYLGALQRAFIRSLGTLSGSRSVLRAENSAGCPALLGVVRPKVILPADFHLRYTRLERLLIFAHERTHLRRGDTAWNALAALVRCVLWFNPLVHLAASCLRVDQELACDAAVLEEHPRSRRSYASAMLKTQLADAALPVGCHWRSAYHLKERLQMTKRPMPGRTRRTCGHVVIAVAALLIGYSAWAAQPAPVAPTTSSEISPPIPLGRVAVSADGLYEFSPASYTFSSSVRVYGSGVTVEDTGGATRVAGPQLRLVLDPGVRFNFHSDHAEMASDGAKVLEGHVRIHADAVHVTRSGTHVIERQVRGVIANAQRAMVTPRQGGGFVVNLEHGSVQF
jgi:beta-lactamase regulating signal transducer with metallopeptidase domain